MHAPKTETIAQLVHAVRGDRGRFPPDFMFRLSTREFESIRSQFVTGSPSGNSSQFVMSSRKHRGRLYLP